METPNFERREQLETKSETIRDKDLVNRIYKGESTPQDNRFLPVEEGGVFKYFNIEDLISYYEKRREKFYSLVEMEEMIVGLAELEKDPLKDKNLWIKFVSVDPRYQGKGFTSKLMEEIFRFAKDEGYSLEPSIYSKEGEEKLEKLIHRFAEKYSIRIIDRE